MNQPQFYQRKPETVQAIRYTGENDAAIWSFLDMKERKLLFEPLIPSMEVSIDGGDYLLPKGEWVVKNPNGHIEIMCNTKFTSSFIQPNEGI